MAKLLLNVLKLSPVVLAATFFVSNGAFASEKVTSVDELAQVTSVDKLSDVSPSHWAFQSVKSLVERYGCVAGYPDGTFRGNRSMSRYEFAALLNNCLDKVVSLIPDSDGVSKDMIAKLREEFSAELATLRGKVDALDFRVEKLEGANRFSKTAKLKGKVEFITGAAFGGGTNNPVEDQVTFGQRTRLDITSSFTGKDKLRVRLHQRDNETFGDARTGTRMSRIDVEGSTGGSVEVEKLNYNFKPSKNISASVWALGAGMDDFLDADKAKVQTTRFAKRNPLTHRTYSEEQGVGATVKFNKNANLQVGYTTANGNQAGAGNGITGDFDLGAQLNFKVGGAKLAATYVRSYLTGGTRFGSSTASANADLRGDDNFESDSYGFQASTKLGKKTKVGGWVGFSNVNNLSRTGSAELFNWAAFASIKDFGKKGNVLGITFGMPPKITSASGTYNETNSTTVAPAGGGALTTVNNTSTKNITADPGTSFLVDVTYRHQITDRLSLQPGVFMITNPDHNSNNDTIWGAVLNTTFKF